MHHRSAGRLSRRRFLRLAAGSTAAIAAVGVPALTSCEDSATGPDGGDGTRSPLAVPATIATTGASLVAAPGASAWLFNGLLPGPTLRARRGEPARLRLVNRLPEPSIVHWHGLLVPAQADGHPRYAIGTGESYDYEFPIVQRAGTFWYHPHAHHRTAGQIHRGLAGFFLISDDEEDALGLPSGPREVLLLLQDRARDGSFEYAPTPADLHGGMLRDVPFGNGVPLPSLEVTGARYRFRVLNGSQARVYLLGLETGDPLTVIGNDGGLLPSAAEVGSVFLGVGERVDFLVDFATVPVSARLMLKSLAFATPPGMDDTHPQGMEMDLLELVRVPGAAGSEPPLPATLSSVPLLPAAEAERVFSFRSTDRQDMHRINGRSFDMLRVDEQIPLGRVERWVFSNESALPHPVHLHGTHFQVAVRRGGRGQVYPYEAGWKDTVLVLPQEAVEVLVRFTEYRGIFPLHCHNLQHEDMGMMLNVEVI